MNTWDAHALDIALAPKPVSTVANPPPPIVGFANYYDATLIRGSEERSGTGPRRHPDICHNQTIPATAYNVTGVLDVHVFG